MSAGVRQEGQPAADLDGAGASACPAPGTPGAPLAWSIDDADGWLQGPLDLAYLAGRCLSLTLRDGQSALLVDDERALATFGAGTRELPVDADGRARGGRRLLFFVAGRGPDLAWTAESPLWREGDCAHLTGACSLDVCDPALFFDTFLAGGGIADATFVQVLVNRLTQGLIDRLAADGGALPGAGDLDAALAPCGLACRQLFLLPVQPAQPAAPTVPVPA